MPDREKFDYTASFQKYELVGNLLTIFTYPSLALTKIAEPVTIFDKELENFCKNLLFTMYQAPGIGLAAPQVGVSKRIFVIDLNYQRKEVTRANGQEDFNYTHFAPLVLINPEIKLISGEIIYEEGCLSVPGVYEEVKRTEEIEVTFQNIQGEHQTMAAHGLLSVCLQHENDHLNGIVFIEKLSSLKKNLIKKKFLKEKKRKKI